MKMIFPQQLKEYRKKFDMSQEELAVKLYISRQAVSRWESGSATPDLTNLIKLTEIFDCSLDSLIFGIEANKVLDDTKTKDHEYHLNFWDWLAKFWWLIFPIGGYLTWFVPTMVHAFK